jgi:glutamate receptor, ionotropic, plant
VIGKSYRELTHCSSALGFSKNIIRHQVMDTTNTRNDSNGVFSTVYWPGDLQSVPKGWIHGNEERSLKIGVPANGVFTKFVNVTHDSKNGTLLTGFSIGVFKVVVKCLPYD